MNNKSLALLFLPIFFYLTIYPYKIFAAKILASITPIASIVKMLVEDKIEVDSIVLQNSCPDHYQASFGDLKKIKNADLVIYIHEAFDHFIAKLIQQNKTKITIKISDFQKLNLIKNNHHFNWHFWLDLNNTKIVLEELAIILSDKFPDLKEDIAKNLIKAQQKINQLAQIKENKLKNLSKMIITSDSLEYLFLDRDYDVIKVFDYDHKSTKYLKLLQHLSDNKGGSCIILSSDQNIKIYQKFSIPIVQLESENWRLEGNLSDLFYNKYLQLMNNLEGCIF